MERDSTQSWLSCTLCRAGREGISTLQRAQTRTVQWPQTQTGLRNTLEDPEIYTSLDDAFSVMAQFMKISSRKCKRYHHSHRPLSPQSPECTHYLRYHTDNFSPSSSHNPLSRSCDVHVQAPPGSYTVTASSLPPRGGRERRGKKSVHHVKLEQDKAVTITLNL